MNKLIKLSDTHYIIVDDSEIKGNDFGWDAYEKKIFQAILNWKGQTKNRYFKITHSTQPLNQQCQNACSGFCINCPDTSVRRLSLSEIEEAIDGYSVIEKSKEYRELLKTSGKDDWESYISCIGFLEGFKAHQELVKDKLFTIEDMASFMFNTIKNTKENTLKLWKQTDFEDVIKAFVKTKTEWDIEINGQNKITLI